MKRVPHAIAANEWRDRLERFKQSGLTVDIPILHIERERLDPVAS